MKNDSNSFITVTVMFIEKFGLKKKKKKIGLKGLQSCYSGLYIYIFLELQ